MAKKSKENIIEEAIKATEKFAKINKKIFSNQIYKLHSKYAPKAFAVMHHSGNVDNFVQINMGAPANKCPCSSC